MKTKNEGKEQTGKHQLTGSSSCTNMKCYSEIQTKTRSSVAFQIVLLNNAIKTCHLDRLTLRTSPAYLIFYAIFFFTLGSKESSFFEIRRGRAEGSTRTPAPQFKTHQQVEQLQYYAPPCLEMKIIFQIQI